MSGFGFGGKGASTARLTKTVQQSAIPVSTGGSLAWVTLALATIPAGSMGNNGAIGIESTYTVTNSPNNKTIRVRFGGVSVQLGTLTASTALTTKTTISNRGNATTQLVPLNGGVFQRWRRNYCSVRGGLSSMRSAALSAL